MKALVIGATGISGWNTARRLLDNGWEVHGVSRRPADGLDGVTQMHVDITDREASAAAIRDSDFTHVFYSPWQRRPSEIETLKDNDAMLATVLDPLPPTV